MVFEELEVDPIIYFLSSNNQDFLLIFYSEVTMF
jgi:hypothetical protein